MIERDPTLRFRVCEWQRLERLAPWPRDVRDPLVSDRQFRRQPVPVALGRGKLTGRSVTLAAASPKCREFPISIGRLRSKSLAPLLNEPF